jgi:hypothetical protein
MPPRALPPPTKPPKVFEVGGTTRVKASQCFTKYLWRDEAAAEKDGGPAIVATQVGTLVVGTSLFAVSGKFSRAAAPDFIGPAC